MTKKLTLPLVVVAGVFSLSGCQIMPTFIKPTAPVPNSYPASDSSSAKPIADTGWNDFFQNPDLREAISTALKNNRDLKTAVLQIEEARALYGIQRADQLPTINATAGGSTSRQLLTTGSMYNSTIYQAGIGLSAFELDFFGRVKNLSSAALSQYLATEEARRAIQISLVGEVAKAWLIERALAEQITLAERTLKGRESSRDLVRKRLDAGITNAMEFQQSETLVYSAKVVLLGLRRQHATAVNALTLLTGSNVKLPTQTATLSTQVITADISAGLPSDLLERRPDIRAAEQRLRATQANIAAARAAFFPRISLTTGYGFASNDLGGLFDGGSRTWSFLPQITLPIFDNGRNKASLNLAEIRSDIAITNYEKTIQVAFREVADALSARATLTEEIEAQTAFRNAQAERLTLARARYENGISSYLDLLDAERELFTAEQALVQSQLLRLTNAVDLYRSLGGGFSEPEK